VLKYRDEMTSGLLCIKGSFSNRIHFLSLDMSSIQRVLNQSTSYYSSSILESSVPRRSRAHVLGDLT